MTNDENVKIIAENIRRVRLANHMTQAQFGDVIGKSQSTIYGYEKGDLVPPFDVIIKISSIFNVPLGVIMQLENPVLPGEEIRKLYRIYMDLYDKYKME